MQLEHFLVTRFSYRMVSAPEGFPRWEAVSDPLEPRRLATRMKLFELFGAPSVLHQSVKDFSWVIVVDRDLRREHRDRLKELTAGHARTRIANYEPGCDMGSLRWLTPFIGVGTSHVITTNVDDDDLMSVDYVGYVQDHLRGLEDRGRLPSCKVIGCRNPVQWDLLPTTEAPFGYLKPWHRGAFVTNAGYTFFGRYPGYDMSALAFRHKKAAKYFDPHRQDDQDTSLARLRAGAVSAGDDWSSWSPADHVHEMQAPTAQIVVLNHIANNQWGRLFEATVGRKVVTGPEDFPGMALDFDKLRSAISSFECSPATVAGLVSRILASVWSSRDRTVAAKVQLSRDVLRIPVWFTQDLFRRKADKTNS